MWKRVGFVKKLNYPSNSPNLSTQEVVVSLLEGFRAEEKEFYEAENRRYKNIDAFIDKLAAETPLMMDNHIELPRTK